MSQAGVDTQKDGLEEAPPPVDLDVRVTTRVVEGQTVLSYLLNSPNGRVNLSYPEFSGEPIRGTLDAYQKRLEGLFKGLDTGGEALLSDDIEDKLKGIGRILYKELFPPEMRRTYRKIRDQVETLRIISNEPWIPWELVKPYDDSDLEDLIDDDFLCEKFELTRWLASGVTQEVTLEPKGSIQVGKLACLNAGSLHGEARLRHSEHDCRTLEGLARSHPGVKYLSPQKPTFDALKSLILEGELGLLHISARGQFDTSQPNAEVVWLGDRNFQPEDLHGALQTQIRTDRPLVFLNACESTKQDWSLTRLGGWVEAWVARCGCGAFVGSQWAISDSLAHEFAKIFYEELDNGKTFGSAAQATRRRLKGNPARLAYTVYAHPNAKLDWIELHKKAGDPIPPSTPLTPGAVSVDGHEIDTFHGSQDTDSPESAIEIASIKAEERSTTVKTSHKMIIAAMAIAIIASAGWIALQRQRIEELNDRPTESEGLKKRAEQLEEELRKLKGKNQELESLNKGPRLELPKAGGTIFSNNLNVNFKWQSTSTAPSSILEIRKVWPDWSAGTTTGQHFFTTSVLEAGEYIGILNSTSYRRFYVYRSVIDRIKRTGKLRVGTVPSNLSDFNRDAGDGQIYGYDADVVKWVALRLSRLPGVDKEVEVEWYTGAELGESEGLTIDNLLVALKARRIDLAISAMSATKGRESQRNVKFTRGYYTVKLLFVGTRLEENFPDNLSDAKVGVVAEGTNRSAAERLSLALGFQVEPRSRVELVYQDLIGGDIRYALLDNVFAAKKLKEGEIHVISPDLTECLKEVGYYDEILAPEREREELAIALFDDEGTEENFFSVISDILSSEEADLALQKLEGEWLNQFQEVRDLPKCNPEDLGL